MTALFLAPSSFTSVNGNATATNPVSNLNVDHPGLVWRSSNLTTVYLIVDLGTSASYDTVALVNSNLRSTDTVRVRTGSTNTGVGSYDSTALAAYSGTKSSAVATKSIIDLGTARTERYMRIDITATSHPDAYVQAERLVVGTAVSTEGIDTDVEQGFVDQSIITNGPGFTSVDEYPVLPTWRFRMSWISDEQWRDEFFPFFLTIGQRRGFLFVPVSDDTARIQHDTVFGRLTTMAKGQHNNYDNWVVEGTVQAISV